MHTQLGLPEAWRDAALHVLGEITLYRPAASVPTDELVRLTYKYACQRAENPLPSTVFYTQMWEELDLKQRGVLRAGSLNLSRYLSLVDDLTVSTPRCGTAIKDSLSPLLTEGMVTVSNNKWSLTLAGVERAVSLRPAYSTRNVTSLWVASRIDEAYISRLTAALSQWCTRSAQFGEISDLIHNYMAGILRRDGFRKRIASGRHPAFSDVKQWVYNTALSTWRDEGRDAQTRAFKGARTEKDLRQENDDDVAGRSISTETQGIFLVTDGEGDIGSMASSGALPMPLVDVLGGNFEDEMIHRLSWQRGMERASSVVRRVKQGAPERFDRLLHDVVDGDADCKDIEKAEGVSRNRAATLITALRTSLTRERDLANLALSIFAYLKENPYSTKLDMEAPVNDDKDASDGGIGVSVPLSLLAALEEAGRIESCGSGSEKSYTLTDAGEAALFGGDYFGVDLEIHRPTRGVGSAASSRV